MKTISFFATMLVIQAAGVLPLPSNLADVPITLEPLQNFTIDALLPALNTTSQSTPRLTAGRQTQMLRIFEAGMEYFRTDLSIWSKAWPLALAVHFRTPERQLYNFLLATDAIYEPGRLRLGQFVGEKIDGPWYFGQGEFIDPIRLLDKVELEDFRQPVVTYDDAIRLSSDFCRNHNCRAGMGHLGDEGTTIYMVSLKDKPKPTEVSQSYYAFVDKKTSDFLLIGTQKNVYRGKLEQKWPPLWSP